MGGCRYHVTHPGGRNFQTLPVNALEAESRRGARFVDMGHSPGSASFRTVAVHADSPLTLDLRRTQPGPHQPGTAGSLACHTRNG